MSNNTKSGEARKTLAIICIIFGAIFYYKGPEFFSTFWHNLMGELGEKKKVLSSSLETPKANPTDISTPAFGVITAPTNFYSDDGKAIGEFQKGTAVFIVEWSKSGSVLVKGNGLSGWVSRNTLGELMTQDGKPWPPKKKQPHE